MNGRLLILLGWTVLLAGCPSQWKIHGGPGECVAMCNSWNLQFAGMVGVGDQSASGPGATACVCQVPMPPAAPHVGMPGGAASASMAGPITAAQAAAAATLAHQQQMQMQQHHSAGRRY